MKGNNKLTWFGLGILCTMIIGGVFVNCSRKPAATERGDVAEAAVATYVAPGDTDE